MPWIQVMSYLLMCQLARSPSNQSAPIRSRLKSWLNAGGGRDCEALLEAVKIVSRESNGRLRLKVERPDQRGKDQLDLDVFVRVPQGAPVELDLGVGKAEIYGIDQDLKVEVGVGDVELELSERQVSDIKLDVGVGSARLWGGSRGEERRKKGFLGSTVRWGNGPGRADVNVHVGVGEISMRLN